MKLQVVDILRSDCDSAGTLARIELKAISGQEVTLELPFDVCAKLAAQLASAGLKAAPLLPPPPHIKTVQYHMVRASGVSASPGPVAGEMGVLLRFGAWPLFASLNHQLAQSLSRQLSEGLRAATAGPGEMH